MSKIQKVKVEKLWGYKDSYGLDLFPEKISFEITNTNASIANAIRRTLLDELESKQLDFADSNTEDQITSIETDDKDILDDFIRTRIRNIPLNQEVSDSQTYKLHVKNTTAVPIIVRSDQIIGGKKGDFNKTFRLFTLNPSKEITINNIHVVRGYGYQDASFSIVGGVGYKALDEIPLSEDKSKGKSSLECNPAHYYMEVTLNGNINPKKLLKKCMENILERIIRVENAFEEAKKSDEDVYESDVLDIIYEAKKNIYRIHNETYTIGNLLSRAIYNLDTTIPMVNCTVPHPDSRLVVVNVITTPSNRNKIFGDAIKKIKAEFTSLAKQC